VEAAKLSEAEPFGEEDQAKLQRLPEVPEYWSAVDEGGEVDVTMMLMPHWTVTATGRLC
jgi:hypothetical protein